MAYNDYVAKHILSDFLKVLCVLGLASVRCGGAGAFCLLFDPEVQMLFSICCLQQQTLFKLFLLFLRHEHI